jgi:hypothetical protein
MADPQAAYQRVMDRVTTNNPAACWEWTMGTDGSGYGIMAVKLVNGPGKYGWRASRVHRIVWTVVNGPIPAGLVIDHTCINRLCCNPAHLQVVTQAENVRLQAERTLSETCERCGANDWYYAAAQRVCRACRRIRTRRWQRDQRPAKQCVWCGSDFIPTMQNRRLCSDPCRLEYGRDFRRRKYHEVYKHQDT